MARQGLWSEEPWVTAVNEQEFGALVLMFDLTLDVPSPVDATVLSIPKDSRFHFQKDAALFQIQSGEKIGPVIIPIAGEMIEIKSEPGQRVETGESLALIAPQISKLTSQRFPAAVLSAMRKHYSLHKRFGDYRIYLPIQH